MWWRHLGKSFLQGSNKKRSLKSVMPPNTWFWGSEDASHADIQNPESEAGRMHDLQCMSVMGEKLEKRSIVETA